MFWTAKESFKVNKMNLKIEWIIISNPASIQILASLLDNIMDEIQEKMVEYNVNGYISILKSDYTNIDLNF